MSHVSLELLSIQIVVTNNMTTRFVENGRECKIPYLGEIWTYAPQTRLHLMSDGSLRLAKLVKPLIAGTDTAKFKVSNVHITYSFLLHAYLKTIPKSQAFGWYSISTISSYFVSYKILKISCNLQIKCSWTLNHYPSIYAREKLRTCFLPVSINKHYVNKFFYLYLALFPLATKQNYKFQFLSVFLFMSVN